MPYGLFFEQIWANYIAGAMQGFEFGRRLGETGWLPNEIGRIEDYEIFALLRYYDSQPFDENTDNPRRILVRMWEVIMVLGTERMMEYYGNAIGVTTTERNIRFQRNFDREIFDWR